MTNDEIRMTKEARMTKLEFGFRMTFVIRASSLVIVPVRCVDFNLRPVHISAMNFDISHILDKWEYHPGQVVVRKFVGKDGQEKIQLRVDLGLLQMNAQGRPDGKRPFGATSLYEHQLSRLNQHTAKHDGNDEGFTLSPEEVAKIQLEALQYHHRYICLL